jgi:O-antigen/teichoic acid export membrane protein
MFVSMFFQAATVKIFALVLGPAGIGFLSILRQLQTLAASIFTAGGGTVLIQGLSSRTNSEREIFKRCVAIFFLFGTLLSLAAIPLASKFLAVSLGNPVEPSNVLTCALVALPVSLSVVSAYLLSLLTARQELGRIAMAQVSAGIASAAVAYPAALLFDAGYRPAILLSVFSAQTVLCAILWRRLRALDELPPLRDLPAWFEFDRSAARVFLTFAGALFVTSTFGALVNYLIRLLISRQYGLSGVGLFEAGWTLSAVYVGLITSAFSNYYLPALSAIEKPSERVDLISVVFRFSMLLSVPLICGVVIFKGWLLRLLFSKEFDDAINLVRWMLIGDYFKLASWVLAFPMLAFSHKKLFVITELIWQTGLLVGAFWITRSNLPMENFGVMFVLCYSTYAVFTYWFCRAYYGFRLDFKIALTWLLGFLVILLSSYVSWREIHPNMLSVSLTAVAVLSFLFVATSLPERENALKYCLARIRRTK